MTAVPDRIRLLREAMQRASIDVLILPSADPHLSEYLPAYWQSRAWFSGFTGSAGTLVVGKEKASLWVDSRYWEQAEKQLQNSGIEMCRLTGVNSRNHVDWILSYFPAGKLYNRRGIPAREKDAVPGPAVRRRSPAKKGSWMRATGQGVPRETEK